jgi:hypothetical protein
VHATNPAGAGTGVEAGIDGELDGEAVLGARDERAGLDDDGELVDSEAGTVVVEAGVVGKITGLSTAVPCPACDDWHAVSNTIAPAIRTGAYGLTCRSAGRSNTEGC